MNRPRLHVAAQYLRPGNGGIAEVARVSMKALARHQPTLGHACLEREDFVIAGARARAYGGRARFLLGLEAASLSPSRFLYDFAGTARSASLLFPRRPYAVWAHGIEVWDDVRADRARALARAEIVLVNSEYTRDRAAPTLGGLRDVRLCRLGAFDDEAAPPRVRAAGPPTVLLIGRVEPGWPKGQGILVSLWPRVVAAAPDARLLLVGRGPALEALRELARKSSAAAQIEVAGFVPEAEIENVWRRASVFAMPSLTEGFGLVFIEAMRRGLPVIASLADAGREVNVDGETGYTIARDDEGRLVDAIVALLRDADLAARLGAAGQARFLAEFRFSAFERRLTAALGDFLR